MAERARGYWRTWGMTSHREREFFFPERFNPRKRSWRALRRAKKWLMCGSTYRRAIYTDGKARYYRMWWLDVRQWVWDQEGRA